MYDMSGNKINMNKDQGSWDWQWYHKSENDKDVKNFLKIVKNQEKPYEIELTKAENFDNIQLEANYNILQLTYTYLKDETLDTDDEETSAKKLIAYFPVAIKRKDLCDYMEGTRIVLYNSQGLLENSTYTDAYILYKEDEDSPVDVEWEIKWDDTLDSGETINEGRPILVPLNKEGSPYKALQPSASYVKGQNDRACIYAKNESGEVAWSQPLLIIQSDYGFPMINNWSGATEVGEASIKATVFCAGKKNEFNKFSGLMMGDFKKSEENSEITQAGLYGISDNKVTFSLTDSGVASFGRIAEKVGDVSSLEEEYRSLVGDNDIGIGSIQLGGESNWLRDKKRINVMFDIDNGYLDMTNPMGRGLTLSSLGTLEDNKIPLLNFKNGEGVSLFEFDDSKAIIRSSDKKLALDLEASTLSMQKDNNNKLTFDAKNDNTIMKVNSFELSWDGSIVIGKFKVDKDGVVYYDNIELSELITQLINDN